MTPEIEELLSFKPSHLGWPCPPVGEFDGFSDTEVHHILTLRKQRIVESDNDPLTRGYEPKIWLKVREQIADLRTRFPKGVIKIIIWGGNRSSKTRFASNHVLRDIVKGKRDWWCCDSTEAMSRTNQMKLLWEQFPAQWKDLHRDKIVDINYTLSDGFSKNLFVTPESSKVEFKFYSMDIGNLPGPELDGIWADELIPLEWVETLVYRLVNRNGILLITFTPELGWNETFQFFYEGAQTIEESDAELLPKYDNQGRQIGCEKVPRVMQCADPTARIVFFHTQDNPFGNYPALVQELKKKSREEILIRAYGLATKSHSVAFPRFNIAAHVITLAQFRQIQKEYPRGERYHLVDPCDGRMWFQIWVYCPRPDKWVIYREFPSHSHQGAYIQGIGMLGPWALSGAAADGVKGPAQDSRGWSLERYIEEIEHQEGDEQIAARYIDSRYATSPKSERERMTTLIEQLSECGIDFLAMVAGKGRIIGIDSNDGSVDLINSMLYYDPETEIGKWSNELGRLNEPQLQIVETCPNVIDSLSQWTGIDGQRGARKDPIDCIRGMVLSSVNYIGENQYVFQGGGVK